MQSTTQTAARALQLGLLARDMARTKRGSNTDRARGHVVERLGRLHGLPQKIGQILSLGELDLSTTVYTPLTETAAAIPAEQAFNAIEHELGRPVRELFRDIESEGIAASLAQVHRATLLDGRRVAVKVQYPGIEDAVWTDLKALGWMTAPVGGLNRGFNVRAYQDEVQRVLGRELDYSREAKTLATFQRLTAGWPDVEVPTPISEFSNSRVLTMTWLDGEPPETAQRWTSAQRHAAARTLLRFFLASCFKWGHLHGDPHPGNLRFRLDKGQPVIGVLDFGCTKQLEQREQAAVESLVRLTINGALADVPDQVTNAYLDLGFNPDLLEPMAHVLPQLTEVLLAPFAHHGPYNVASWRMADRVKSVLGEEHRWNFRLAGPAQMMVFLRAYQGVIQYLKALDASVNWRMTFEQVAGSTSAEAQPSQPMPAPGEEPRSSACLRIQVMESGRQKVAVTFRARAAAFLHELLPDDLGPKLSARGIDVAAIEENVVKTGFAPAELFALTEGEKRIRVWLE